MTDLCSRAWRYIVSKVKARKMRIDWRSRIKDAEDRGTSMRNSNTTSVECGSNTITSNDTSTRIYDSPEDATPYFLPTYSKMKETGTWTGNTRTADRYGKIK